MEEQNAGDFLAPVVKWTMPDSTFNLTALSERLPKERRLKPLAGKIRRAQDLASLHADLMMASECMDALDASLAATPGEDDMTRSITEASLLSEGARRECSTVNVGARSNTAPPARRRR